jgi:uncharacterized membrane protein
VRVIRSLHPRLASGRIALSLAVGVIVGVLLSQRYELALAAAGGWDVAALILLALAWMTIARFDAQKTRQRAAEEDPGRTALYALTLLTSAISLVAATVLIGGSRGLSTRASRELIVLCLVTAALSWTLTHTAFALRYAHLYYRDGGDGSGVDFPGDGPPRYFDFAYLAFTVGMTFQVSDTQVTGAQVRRTVLLHALISFAYNTAILAFILQLVFGFVPGAQKQGP